MSLHRYRLIGLMLIVALCLQGCSIQDLHGAFSEEKRAQRQSAQKNIEEETQQTDMGYTGSQDYTVPSVEAHIFINQLGYQNYETKVAIFAGENVPETFRVVDAQNGKTVYTGLIEERTNISEQNYYTGDFSEWTTPGRYYLEADHIGQSYLFDIEDNIYEQVLSYAQKRYYLNRCGITLTEEYADREAHNACHTKMAVKRADYKQQMDVSGGWHVDGQAQKDMIKACYAMTNLLLGYEVYPESFTDAVGIPESGNEIPDILDEARYETEWLLKMQDSISGAVYSGVTVQEQGAGESTIYVENPTLEATAAFAAVMAKFSYLYQNYDTEYATRCLQAADRAFRYVDNNRGMEEVAWRFFAATELYRATGYYNYNGIVNAYMEQQIYQSIDDMLVMWGCVTYLSTRQRVDVNYCNLTMKKLSNMAEEISSRSKNGVYYVPDEDGDDTADLLLQDMMSLCIMNYVISNHEYGNVLENCLHYFLGRNGDSMCYIDHFGTVNASEDDSRKVLTNNLRRNSELIFLVSEIIGNSTE